MSEQKKHYSGSCHCGAVKFAFDSDLGAMGDCNCSRCRRLGWVMQAVPAQEFTLLSGADKLTTYRFNTEKIEHLSCSACGIESFARGTGPDGAGAVMVNVNCLDEPPPIDRTAIHHWDGRSW